MKYSIKIIILLCIVLSSCKKDNSYSTFKVQNSSNHDVYFGAYSQTVGIVFIPKGEYYLWTVPEGNGTVGWLASNADSVSIIFDNTKKVTYYNQGLVADSIFRLKRNPINTTFLSEECIRKDGCDYTYIITEEDYENAEILNPNL